MSASATPPASPPATRPVAHGLADILAALAADPSAGAGYRPIDRHRDFVRVFLGSDEGRRVFAQIMTMGRLFGPCHDIEAGAEANAFAAGRRDLALRLFDIVNVQPEPEDGQE